MFRFFNINNITIKDGYFDYSNTRSSNSSVLYVNLAMKFYCHLKILNTKEMIHFEINGIFWGFIKSFYGQLSFLHNNKLSTIAVNALDDSYRFSLNLHSYEWLNFIQLLILR